MSRDPVLLTRQAKKYTVDNAVDYLEEEKLPYNARSVHLQPIRNISVTIQILDEETEEVIDTITGLAKSGSVSLESDSLVRRSSNLDLMVTEDTYPQEGSLIWFNKIAKFYVGIQDMSQHDVEMNFLLGTYWIDEASFSINEKNSEIKVKLRDRMTKWEGKKLEKALTIPTGVPIHTAIRMFMENLGETKFGYFDESLETEVVPYKLEYKLGEDITKCIKDLRDMYMDYVCGYNVRGEFEFKKVQVQKEDEVADPKWSFDSENTDRSDLTLSFSETYSLKDVRNKVVVYGNTSDKTGLTPMGETRITDARSPFNVYSIGERTDIQVEDKYVTDDQCIAKAKYEVMKASNFKEVCDISCIPIYILDAYDTIEVVHPKTKMKSKYIIDSFNMDLSPDSNMSIKAHKLYYVSVEYGEDKNPLVDAVIKGVHNWGWLSLGEERIAECYNISGAGTAKLTVRFQDVVAGGEQASVTSYPTTKNQTMLIDLADIAEIDFDDPNGGAPNRSTGDYLDRVLGHEMFHAVTNDYLGHDAMISTPIWFNEGFAEFLHGARERFESVYTDLTQAEKKTKLIDLAKKVMDNNWTGTSEEYVAAYLVAISIYRKSSTSQWKNLFIRLRGQSNLGINFLYKLLPIASTNDGVKTALVNEITNMNDVWTWLFNKNDKDTGSVGGIHFMNIFGTALNAENVFNNSNATVDSIGFQLDIQR